MMVANRGTGDLESGVFFFPVFCICGYAHSPASGCSCSLEARCCRVWATSLLSSSFFKLTTNVWAVPILESGPGVVGVMGVATPPLLGVTCGDVLKELIESLDCLVGGL